MQVQSTKIRPEFNPIEVKLTFETEEEFTVFKDSMGYDHSVPEFLYYSSKEGCGKTLSEIMRSVYQSMYDTQHKE